MGNGCQALFRRKLRKLSHWDTAPNGHGTALHPRTQWVRVSGAIRATIEKPGVLVPVFPLKWEIVPVFPAHLRNDDGLAFPATP